MSIIIMKLMNPIQRGNFTKKFKYSQFDLKTNTNKVF